MRKNIKILVLILLASLVTTACTVMIKNPTPAVKIKVQDDNGLHKGQYK